MTAIDELVVADTPEAWTAAGFDVDPDGGCRVGNVRINLIGREHGLGLVGWAIRDLPAGVENLDGIATVLAEARPFEPAAHPNGVVSIDHVVVLSPHLRRTVAAFEAIGVEPRRERDGELGGQPIRQVFFRFGSVIVEVVGSPETVGEGPSTLWGITYVVNDIEAAAAFFGERTSRIKDAVQPGRRITTVRHRDLDLSVRTALITEHVRG